MENTNNIPGEEILRDDTPDFLLIIGDIESENCVIYEPRRPDLGMFRRFIEFQSKIDSLDPSDPKSLELLFDIVMIIFNDPYDPKITKEDMDRADLAYLLNTFSAPNIQKWMMNGINLPEKKVLEIQRVAKMKLRQQKARTGTS